MQAIAAEVALTPRDPDGPGMFRCAAHGYVSALYEAAGLGKVAEWNVGVELVTRSPAEYWEMISEHVSLAVAALRQVDKPERERIAKAVVAKAEALVPDHKPIELRIAWTIRRQVACRHAAAAALTADASVHSRRDPRNGQVPVPGFLRRRRHQRSGR